MHEYFERNAIDLQSKQVLDEDKMSRGRNGEEFRYSLNETEKRCFPPSHDIEGVQGQDEYLCRSVQGTHCSPA